MHGDLILTATQIYSYGAQPCIHYQLVNHPLFEVYCRYLGQIYRQLGRNNDHEVWRQFLRPHFRYRDEHVYAPISFEIGSLFESEVEASISHQLRMIRHLFSHDLYAMAKRLVEKSNELRRYSKTPLQEIITNLIQEDVEETILVVKDRSLAQLASAVLTNTSLSNLPIVTPNKLSDVTIFRRIIVFGNPNKYPDYIFAAPRAPEIHIIQFESLHRKIDLEPTLRGTTFSKSASRIISPHYPPDHSQLSDDIEDKTPEEESFDVDSINLDFRDDPLETGTIDAQPVLLYGGYITLTDPSSFKQVIDPDESENYEISLTRTRHLRPGMYLLIRTGSDGDYIRETADLLMGQKATELRTYQQNWKRKLRNHIDRKGPHQVCIELSELGAIRATPENLRNWVSPSSIGTDHLNDFRAILTLVGLAEHTEYYWQAMKKIRQAHVVAGRKIRKQLLKQIQQTELHELEVEGMMDFCLNELGEIRMSAFKILKVSQKTVRTPSSRLMRLLSYRVRSVG